MSDGTNDKKEWSVYIYYNTDIKQNCIYCIIVYNTTVFIVLFYVYEILQQSNRRVGSLFLRSKDRGQIRISLIKNVLYLEFGSLYSRMNL